VKRVVAYTGNDPEENFHFAKFDLSITALRSYHKKEAA